MAGDPRQRIERTGRRPGRRQLPEASSADTSVEAAAVHLADVTADLLLALQHERSNADQALRDGQAEAQRTHDRAVAIARNLATNAVEQLRDVARGARARLTPGLLSAGWDHEEWQSFKPEASALAEYVQVGKLEVPGRNVGLNSNLALPLLLPALNHDNIIIRGIPGPLSARAHCVLLGITLRLLTSTGPGQLSLHIFDPSLSGTFAPLASLRDANETLYERLGTASRDLQAALSDYVTDVQRVTELCGTRANSLADLRQLTGQTIEPFHLVVLLDFPKGFDRQTFEQLLTLLQSGPSRGTSFLVHMAAQADLPDDIDLSRLSGLGSTLAITEHGVTWEAVPDCDVLLDDGPPGDLVQLAVNRLREQVGTAAAPILPITELLPANGLWSGTSTDGVTVAIGRQAHETVELTLGDDREQRHNVLITGAVGQGKSNLLSVIIHGLVSQYSPSELELYLLDFKDGMTFYPLAPSASSPDWLPHARVIGVESDRQFGVAVLEYLFAEFERRATIIKPYGDNIGSFRRQVPSVRMPRIVTIIDEFHVLFEEGDQLTDRAVQLLERLARRGRAYGIHLILASQTISGIAALMAKEGSIFSQFPIRIALKNSVSESRAVLDQENIEAARLRFRGEAIFNVDFGQREGNRRVIVAAAHHSTVTDLRHRCWQRFSKDLEPPRVFNGGKALPWSDLVQALKALRRRRLDGSSERMAILGQPVTVEAGLTGIVMLPEPGRHLAMLGSAESSREMTASAQSSSTGAGPLHAAAVALALQHPEGDCRFTIIDLAGPSEKPGGILAAVLADLGVDVEAVGRDDLVPTLRRLANALSTPSNGVAHYVIAIALDRAGTLARPDESMTSPVDALRDILRDGPTHHLHLLAWWSNIAMYKAHIGFDADMADGVLALRLDQRDVVDLMGYTVEWKSPPHRGLLYDRTYAPQPTTIVPAAPLSLADRQLLRRVDWDA